MGNEAEGKGFTWKTKQKMVHAWEQYQLSEGMHAPRSFKSMIDPELVPLVCAECCLEEGDWELIDDVALLSAIEERLKPHDAMDFTVQLRQIRFEADEAKGTLTQRYRLFAEPFLAKVSEAKAAGCALQENVIKLTFTRAVSANPILQGWCEQVKWTSAAETHRRITNQLKMVDAYNTLTNMTAKKPADHQHIMQAAPQPTSQAQMVHQPQQQQGGRYNKQQMQAAVNSALAAYQQAQAGGGAAAPVNGGHYAQAGGGGGHSVNGRGVINAMQQQQPHKPLPPFPGLDTRGINWHVHSAHLGCKANPCCAPFCQACALHGHTANECRKRVFNNPAINPSGYWCEQKPNCAPIRFPRPATANAAVQAPVPFPAPYVMNGVAHVQQQPLQHANGKVNQQNGNVNHSTQQPPAPPGDDGRSAQ